MSETLTTMTVPMNDLGLQYREIKRDVDLALSEVIEENSFILGPQVKAFESSYARFQGVDHCIGVSNGTDALKLALRACGIGAGCEVVTTPFTFGATVEAIVEVGATTVFVDIEEDHYTLDVEQLAASLTGNTRAILPVHLYGHPADLLPITKTASERDLLVIEDASQAHGARYREQRVGSIGDIGCFSFYPGKNLGAYGDAGGVVTRSDDLAREVRLLRNHGQDPDGKFSYLVPGYNHRMDGFQGAVLDVKLPHLEGWNEKRRQNAARYIRNLSSADGVTTPGETDNAHHVYHLFVVRCDQRDDLADFLRKWGIQTAVHYPLPLHLTPAFDNLGYGAGDFPVSERCCQEILSLPMFPELQDDQIDYVCEKIHQFVG
jgi:dTDP-4-amino-4,6-dideoxygalactose transaminase